MRWNSTGFRWLAAILLMLLLLPVILLPALDDDDYRRLTIWSVKHFTGCNLTIDGDFHVDFSLTPSLSAEDIRLVSAENDTCLLPDSVGRLDLSVDLIPLVFGDIVLKYLFIDDMVLEIPLAENEDRNGTSRVPDTKGADISLPILKQVRLQNINVTVVHGADRQREEIVLNRLALDKMEDRDVLILDGNGLVNARLFSVRGRLGNITGINDTRPPCPLELKLDVDDFSVTASGTIDNPIRGKGLNVRLNGQSVELANFLRIFQIDETPALGRLQFTALLSGDIEAPQINGLKLTVSDKTDADKLNLGNAHTDKAGSEFTAEGSIQNIITGEGTRVLLSGVCRNREILQTIILDELQDVTEIIFKGHLRDVKGGYTIEKIRTTLRNDKELVLHADGHLDFADPSESPFLKFVDAKLTLSSPTTEAVRPLLLEVLPEMGPVEGSARLVGPVDRLALEDLVIKRGGDGPLRIETRGRIGWIPLSEVLPVSEIDLGYLIESQNSQPLFSLFGIDMEELGNVYLAGRVRGSSQTLRVEDVELRTVSPQGLQSGITGELFFNESDNGDMQGDVNLNLRIDAPDMGTAEPLAGFSLFPDLGPVKAEADILGTIDTLTLENIAITAGSSRQNRMEWRGRIGNIPLSSTKFPSNVDIQASIQSNEISEMAAMAGITMPVLGPFKADWRVLDRKGVYGFNDVNIVIGNAEQLRINGKGSIDSVVRHHSVDVDGVNIDFSVQAPHTKIISILLDQPVPSLGTLKGSFSLSGNQNQLAVSSIKLQTVSDKGIQTTLTGDVANIEIENGAALPKIDLQLAAAASGSAALPFPADINLPEMGPLQLNAAIKDRSNRLDISSFTFYAGEDKQTNLMVQGYITDILHPKQARLNAAYETALRPWTAVYAPELSIPDQRLCGVVDITASDDHLRIDKLQVISKDAQTQLLDAEGRFVYQSEPDDIDFHITTGNCNLTAVGDLFGLTLPKISPLSMQGRYQGDAEKNIFNGKIGFGDTAFQIESSTVLGKHPRIAARVSSPSVYLTDLGFYPEETLEDSSSQAASNAVKSDRLFDDVPLPFDILKKFDLFLNFNAAQITGKNVSLNKMDVQLSLQDNRLRINPLNLNYTQGSLMIDSIVDLSASVPEIAVNVTAEDVDIDDMLRYAHRPMIFKGQLNLAVDLQARGRSSRELASSLNGELGIAIENGKILQNIDLLASDALDLIMTFPVQKKYTDLRCLAAKINFENGAGKIHPLYLSTPKVRARGAGVVNLANETIDLMISPTAKKQLFFLKKRSAVHFSGSLSRPSITKVPYRESVVLAGQIFAPYVALPAHVLGNIWSMIVKDKQEQSPCFSRTLENSTDSSTPEE